MGKVIWHTTLSLDGFIAGPGGRMEWVTGHSGVPPEVFDEIVAPLGAVLAGRRTYDEGISAVGGKVYNGAFDGPVFVLTHRPPADPGPGLEFVSGDIAEVMATVRAAAGGGDIALLGAQTARQCLAAGLVDEVFVHLVPALLGDGVRLFDSPGDDWIDLTAVSLRTAGDLAHLRYRVGPRRTPAGEYPAALQPR
ncbi:dihydrofolate reductase family protein [Catellatospora sp. TT07R-123]|uniref:dihydrofolate reductase family protein n=1 Tax=Catellatospora sp. TT07R-123 TaxID=2733863 RepID=UPI001BB328D8|nr:dihydrofolate reductase family protein [Catellatospora sp. TT07R-123]